MAVGTAGGRRTFLDRRPGGLPGRGVRRRPAAASRADRPVALPTRGRDPVRGGASLRYPFQVRYSAEDYLTNLATQSATHALGEARRAAFFTRVRDRLDSLG